MSICQIEMEKDLEKEAGIQANLKVEEDKVIVKMAFPQGGISWNRSPKSKKGVLSRFKCAICNREYKMVEMRDRHQKQCEEYNYGKE